MRASPRWWALIALVVALGACVADEAVPRPAPSPSGSPSPSSPSPVPVRVAFLEDLQLSDGAVRAAPAFQGAKLAFAGAALAGDLPVSVELVQYDTMGDPARAAEVLAEIEGDPTVVAAIGAPGLDRQGDLGDRLNVAGIPWISLSSLGSGLGDRGWVGWRRLVADQAEQGATLAGAVDASRSARSGVCVVGDGSVASRSLLRSVVEHLEAGIADQRTVSAEQEAVAAAAAEVGTVACGVVVWGGDGSVGGALRRQIVEEAPQRVDFVGGDRIRPSTYLQAAGPAAEGTRSTCPCVDLSTSTVLAAQRFIQDYQAEYGLAPGPYSAEAWDAARMLLAALRSGATTRAEVLLAVAGTVAFEGLAATYRFTPGGDLEEGPDSVGVARVEGGRWISTPSG